MTCFCRLSFRPSKAGHPRAGSAIRHYTCSSLVTFHSSLHLEPFQHPHVAIGGGGADGEVAAVG